MHLLLADPAGIIGHATALHNLRKKEPDAKSCINIIHDTSLYTHFFMFVLFVKVFHRIYTYICVCMHICVCVCVCVCIYLCVCCIREGRIASYMYICMCVNAYVSMYMCVYACVYVAVCVCAADETGGCKLICVLTCVCICLYTCVHICLCVCAYVHVYVSTPTSTLPTGKPVCVRVRRYMCMCVHQFPPCLPATHLSSTTCDRK